MQSNPEGLPGSSVALSDVGEPESVVGGDPESDATASLIAPFVPSMSPEESRSTEQPAHAAAVARIDSGLRADNMDKGYTTNVSAQSPSEASGPG